MLNSALVGYSGFVGKTLSRQTEFQFNYRSTNIEEVGCLPYGEVFCCAAPAKKWIANKDPEADLANIEGLISHLERVECQNFVLISTVDVFKNPIGVNEQSLVNEEGLHAYGSNRRLLEKFVENKFKRSLIVRLPGLVGPGLTKNVIFDFKNENNLHLIDSRGVFQFYPMINLWYDVQIALREGLNLVHLTAEPISVSDVAKYGFNRDFDQVVGDSPAIYDMRTCYAELFGGYGNYQYSKRESIQAIRAYAQSEPRMLSDSSVA